ncbi:MAG: hypothetical protein ICV79_06415 [Flavisolibacter sp.]|nr:hypothetical protein [Flavisolibacter sp.]
MYNLAPRLNISHTTVSRALKNNPIVKQKDQKKYRFDPANGLPRHPFARNLHNQ